MGRRGSLSPARARRTASETAWMASSWPTTRWCSRSSMWTSLAVSPSSSLVTGTPVQAATISAMSSAVTSSLSSRSGPERAAMAASCSFMLRLQLGQPAVLELGGRAVVGLAFGLVDSNLERLDLRLGGPDGRDGVLLASTSAASWPRPPRRSRPARARGLPAGPSSASSVSLRSASRSISSWMRRRSSSSSSIGIESISIRSRLAASSTRSIALSGRKRSLM